MGLSRLKSKRKLSKVTEEPCWATSLGSTFFRAACKRWVAVWLHLERFLMLLSTSAEICSQALNDAASTVVLVKFALKLLRSFNSQQFLEQ